MKFITTLFIFSFISLAICSQQPLNDPTTEINASQLEESAEYQEENPENDDEAQRLIHFIKHPVDINTPDLEQLSMLSPLLIANLSAYRKLLGDLIDLHELQAVPGFTLEIIKSILPYVTINRNQISAENIRERFAKGENSILIRPSIIPEPAYGYTTSSDQKFKGSRIALLLRYKYEFRNLLQYGFVADKDAGEKFFTDSHAPDFTSFHLFARRIGMIKSVAFGDYTINLGQGLIYWQSQAFHKTSSVINIKRQSEVLRPYHSAGEYNFNRGVATTVTRSSSELTVFLSRRNLTANVDDGLVTSIISSGLHRTASEIHDKNSVSLSTAGGVLKQQLNQGHVAVNWVYNRYSLPLTKREEPYNLYSIKGHEWSNYGIDYSFTITNFHVFGELASDKTWSCAYLNGVMASLSKSIDMASLFRYIRSSYQCVYGNAFTENSMPNNEYGLYYGISINPHLKWKIDLYADLFSFPWLKYRVDAPSQGFAYLLQVTWKPDKATEVYSRFRYRMKPLNVEKDEHEFLIPGSQIIQQWRTHVSSQVSRSIILRTRVEVCMFAHEHMTDPANGYLFYMDVVYKPKRTLLSGNLRFLAFESDTYDSRIYAYENDLLFVTSTPSFYNKGIRCYVNLKAKTRLKILSNSLLTANLKFATTVYNNISEIGTGVSKINGNRISTFKLQIFIGR